MSTLVYVLNQNGHSLMPCQPSKARKLLRDQRAKVIGRSPFTIKLLWDCEEQVQEVRLGIDKGSHVTGFCCIGKGQILLSGEIHHRLDVKDKMTARRRNRRHRRHRKWYRPARFLNRASSKRSGRLPSSITTNVEEVIRVVEHIPLPLSSIVIEDVQVDIARLNDPTLRGSQYQEPTRLDENLRMACLMRDGYRCQQCGKQQCRLEAHHVMYRQQGGKDTLTNLLTLCELSPSPPPRHNPAQSDGSERASGPNGATDDARQEPSVCHTWWGYPSVYTLWLSDGDTAQSEELAQSA